MHDVDVTNRFVRWLEDVEGKALCTDFPTPGRRHSYDLAPAHVEAVGGVSGYHDCTMLHSLELHEDGRHGFQTWKRTDGAQY